MLRSRERSSGRRPRRRAPTRAPPRRNCDSRSAGLTGDRSIDRSAGPVLPDPDAAVGRQPEAVSLLDAEGGVELGEVADDAVAPELGGRVRVEGEPAFQLGVAILHPPDPGPAEEE